MLKKLFTSMASLLLLLVLSASVYASGKMEVNLGERVVLQAEEGPSGATYKWVATLGRDIISTQTGSTFTYNFDFQGEYKVALSVTERTGNVRQTTATILVGNRYSTREGGAGGEGTLGGAPKVYFETLPNITSAQSVHIAGDEGRVLFDIAPHEDILEYRIDRNIFVDSDGNGIANDDIDNADHRSYLLGGTWQTTYKASESNRIVAEITAVDSQGRKAKSQVEVLFSSLPSQEGNVVAILDTLPLMSQQDRKIYVYGERDTVAFYSRRSQGDVIEYRIDKNIFVDSDGDGNPSNDIDNRQDISFKTGDVWLADYEKTDEQIIAQLIVVGRGGTGSRIQREVQFTDRAPSYYESTPTDATPEIRLTADKEFVQAGDPILYKVDGLTQDMDRYIFDWDFDGDGMVDQTIEGSNEASYIYDIPGIKPVSVRVQDSDGNEASFTLDLLVQDTEATKSDFEFQVVDNMVHFTNLSTVSSGLASKILDYTWNFGDPDVDSYEAQKDKITAENPSYQYPAPGTYVVTLTVVDADQVTDASTQEVVIVGGAETETPDVSEDVEDEPKVEKSGSIIGKIFKIMLYLILIVIVLVLMIVGGLLAFLKIQHPDLVFEELIDELKIKLLSVMGVHELEHEGAVPEAPAPEATSEESAAAEAPEEAPEQGPGEASQEGAEEQVDLSTSDGPMPDWMKPQQEMPAEEPAASDVIEGEVEEEVAEEPTAQPEVPAAPVEEVSDDKPPKEGGEKPEAGEAAAGDISKDDGPVPDWLKQG